jgi:hypothetical protein
MLGGLKGQDFVKVIIIVAIILGAVLATLGAGEWYHNIFDVG